MTPREETELRLTALLMGELPPEEAAALEAQMAADPELAALHGRLGKAVELLREASALPEPAPEPTELSSERRAKLLAHFKTDPNAADHSPALAPVTPFPRKKRDWSWMPMSLAAALVLMIGGGLMVFQLGSGERRQAKLANAPTAGTPRGPQTSEPIGSVSLSPQDQTPVITKSGAGTLTLNASTSTVGPGANGTEGAGSQQSKWQENGDRTKQLYIEAQGFYDTGRFELAKKRTDQILNIDQDNIAARKLAERVDRKVSDYSVSAYNETRSNAIKDVDLAWQHPIRRFNLPDSSGEKMAAQPANTSQVERDLAGKDAQTQGGFDKRTAGNAETGVLKLGDVSIRGQAAPPAPTAENPIVGRLAFWNDTESSKVNIDASNTGSVAGSGSFSGNMTNGNTIGNSNSAAVPMLQDIPILGNTFKSGITSGTDGLAINGGALSLSGITTYTGATTINEGTLASEAPIPAPGSAGAPQPAPSLALAAKTDRLYRSVDEFYFEGSGVTANTRSGALATNSNAVDALLFGMPGGADLAAAPAVPAPTPEQPAANPEFTDLSSPKVANINTSGNSRSKDKFIRQEIAPSPAPKPQEPSKEIAKLDKELTEMKRGFKAMKDMDPGAAQSDSRPTVAPQPAAVPQPEVQTSANPFSTFSLNVSDVAFKLAAASLEKGQMPDPATVRSEEFINAFNYRDPEPAGGAPLAFAAEQARYPFAQNRDLLRLSVKTAAEGRQPGRALNLVLLLDNSGSMERADRVGILREALRVLGTQLQPQDKLSVVTFARTPRLWADGVSGDKASAVTARALEITPQGGTNLEAALDLGYATARRHYQEGGISRVVLITDGAANLGDVNPEALKRKVEDHRRQGIALDCFGIGWEGYDDSLLETLSRNGDGRYGFINSPEEAATEFAGQLAGALRVAASDVKVQVEFNPKRVTAYRQIGYAKHQLTKEQFRDNTVDAAEIGAAESGNALYALELNPRGEGDVATVRVRFKVPSTSDYREHEWTVPFAGSSVPALDQASPAMRLAGTASAFAEWLVSSPYATEVTTDRLLGIINGVPAVYGADGRPKKLEWMIRQAKSVSGK